VTLETISPPEASKKKHLLWVWMMVRGHGSRKSSTMASDLQSSVSKDGQTREGVAPGWLKVGVVAAASGILGGLAAAWYYRKTLAQLRGADSDEAAHTDSHASEERDYDI